MNRKPVCPVGNVQVKSDSDNNSLVTLIQEHPWLPVVALIGDNDIAFLRCLGLLFGWLVCSGILFEWTIFMVYALPQLNTSPLLSLRHHLPPTCANELLSLQTLSEKRLEK